MATRVRTNSTNQGRVTTTSGGMGLGAFTQLQVLMPGESNAGGTSTGKSGAISPQVAGTSFTVTVLAVDTNWNALTTQTDVIRLTSSDPFATLPSSTTMVAGVASFVVTAAVAGVTTFTAGDVTHGTITSNTGTGTIVSATTFTQVQVLMPGEVASPGSILGKSNTPTPQTSGASCAVTVRAVDAFWNPVSSTHTMAITSSDGSATLPANAALVAGVKIFSVIFNTVGTFTVTATDSTDGAKLPNTGTATTVNANPGTINVALATNGGTASASSSFNGALAPAVAIAGSRTGSGYPSGGAWVSSDGTQPSYLEVDFNGSYQINEVDVFSLQDNYTSPVNPTANLLGTQFVLDTFKIQSWTGITWADIATAATSANRNIWAQFLFAPVTTTKIKLVITTGAPADGFSRVAAMEAWTGSANPFVKLQIVAPGGAKTAGTPFSVTVNAVDFAGNLINTITDTVQITSSDINATLPANAALVAGTGSFSVTLNTAGSATVTASDVTRPAKTAATSSSLTVNAGAFTKLLLIVPNEVVNPGSSTGKGGIVIAEAKDTAFTVVVQAVDAKGNLVSSTDVVGITGGGSGAILPSNHALVAGTYSFSVTMHTEAVQTLTATDITDGAKTHSVVTVTCGSRATLDISRLSWVGAYRVPAEVGDQAWAGFAGRIVGGALQITMLGDQFGTAIEFLAPTPVSNWSATAKPTTITNWGSDGTNLFYGLCRKSWWSFDNGAPGQHLNDPVYICMAPYDTTPTCGWTSYHLTWDEAQWQFIWVFTDNYNTVGNNDFCLGITKPTTHGVSPLANAYGPFQMTQGSHRASGHVVMIPPAFGDAYCNGARFAVGCGMTSGDVANSMGPNLYAVLPATPNTPALTPTTPSGFGSPPLVGRALVSYGGSASDKSLKFKRDNNYFVATKGSEGNLVNDPPDGSVGYWLTNDFTPAYGTGALWIDLPDVDGLLFFGGLATGAEWYMTATGSAGHCALCGVGSPQTAFADPAYKSGADVCPACACNQGPVSEGYSPLFVIYQTSDLARVAQGLAASNLTPASQFDPTAISGASGHFTMNCRNGFCGGYFDAPNRQIHIAIKGADGTSPLVHVLAIA